MTIKQFFLSIVSLAIAFHSPLFSKDGDYSYEFCFDTEKKPSKQRAFLQKEQPKETFSPRLTIFSEISYGEVVTGVKTCEDLEDIFFERAGLSHQKEGVFSYTESEENFLSTNGKNSDESDDQPFDSFNERLYLGSLLDSSSGIYPSTPPLEQTTDDNGESLFFRQPFFGLQQSSSSSIHPSDQTASFFENRDGFLYEEPSLAPSSEEPQVSLHRDPSQIKKKRPISWKKLLQKANTYKKNHDAGINNVFIDKNIKNLALRISQTPLVWHHFLSRKTYHKLSKYSKENSNIHATFALIFCGEKFLKHPGHKDQRSILTRLVKKHQQECFCFESLLAQANLLTIHHFSAPTLKHYTLAKEKWILCLELLRQHEEKSSDYLDYAQYQLAHLMTYAPTLCTTSDLKSALSTLYTCAISGNHFAMFSLGLACFDPYLAHGIQEYLWPKTLQREHYLRGLRFLQTALRIEPNHKSWPQTAYERTCATLGDEKAALLFTPKKGHPPLIINVSGKTLHKFYA